MIRRVRKIIRRTPVDPAGKKVIVVGVDPSLTGTAVVVIGGAGGIEWQHGWTKTKTLQRRHPDVLSFFALPDKPTMSDRLARINLMASWVVDAVAEWSRVEDYETYVAIEGLAVSQRSNRASDLAELSGIIKNRIVFGLKVPLRIYDPMTLKLAWTGKGTADKSMMIMSAFRRFKVDYTAMESAGDNFADALLLAQLLYHEVEVRAGRKDVKHDLDGQLRKVLQRKTKAEPITLLKRPLITEKEVKAQPPVLGTS